MQNIQSLCERIESLHSTHHVAIASIIKEEGNIKMNETTNGIMINMSLVSSEVVQKIERFLDFISKQENSIQEFETQKEECKLLL